ncbi:MAG: c-type cytochrome [Planctomycetota bacterium]
METHNATAAPHDPERPARTPAGILISIIAALAFSVFLVYEWIEQSDAIGAPGAGRLGYAAENMGPRTPWALVAVPAHDATKNPPNAASGELLYNKWCASCHGAKGAGDGILAKALDPPPRDFTKGRFRFRSTPEGSLPSDADLYRSITAGILPSRMPAFEFLTETERWDLVAHIKKLSVFFDPDEQKELNYFELLPPEPEVQFDSVVITKDAAAIERGKKLFMEKGECWKCHGEHGLGDGPSAPTLVAEEGFPIRAANLRRGPVYLKSVATARDVYRVLKLGISGTPMPSYSASLDDNALKDIAAYTETLWDYEPRHPINSVQYGTVQLTAAQSKVEFGERIFLANCAGCHGKVGRGDGIAAGLLQTQPASLAIGIFKFKSTPDGYFPTDADLKRTLRNGVPGTAMPAWSLHTESELDALVGYLKVLSGDRAREGAILTTPVPPFDRIDKPESIANGKQLFAANCTMCHGQDARGDGEFAKIVADLRGEKQRPRDLREEMLKYGMDARSIFRVVSYGFEGTPMPGFSNAISEQDRWDIVSFVRSLSEFRAASSEIK